MLKREGVDVNTFACSIRLQRKLDQNGVSEEQIESVIENMDVHCFKRDLKPEEFINTINKVCIISDNLGISVDGMSEYITQEQEKLNKIRQEIINLQMTKMQDVQDHNVAINTLQEYEKNKPIADYLAADEKGTRKSEK